MKTETVAGNTFVVCCVTKALRKTYALLPIISPEGEVTWNETKAYANWSILFASLEDELNKKDLGSPGYVAAEKRLELVRKAVSVFAGVNDFPVAPPIAEAAADPVGYLSRVPDVGTLFVYEEKPKEKKAPQPKEARKHSGLYLNSKGQMAKFGGLTYEGMLKHSIGVPLGQEFVAIFQEVAREKPEDPADVYLNIKGEDGRIIANIKFT